MTRNGKELSDLIQITEQKKMKKRLSFENRQRKEKIMMSVKMKTKEKGGPKIIIENENAFINKKSE